MVTVLILSPVLIIFLNLSDGLLSVSSLPAGAVSRLGQWRCTDINFLYTIAWLFNIVATGQMYIWAVKKHKNYKKEFKDYPRNRTSMIPFIA